VPLELAVHAPSCTWRAGQAGQCTCTPQRFTDPRVAKGAYGDNSNRLELVAIILPAWRPPDQLPEHKSQLRRHTRVISY
jgi:hypothetical protein